MKKLTSRVLTLTVITGMLSSTLSYGAVMAKVLKPAAQAAHAKKAMRDASAVEDAAAKATEKAEERAVEDRDLTKTEERHEDVENQKTANLTDKVNKAFVHLQKVQSNSKSTSEQISQAQKAYDDAKNEGLSFIERSTTYLGELSPMKKTLLGVIAAATLFATGDYLFNTGLRTKAATAIQSTWAGYAPEWAQTATGAVSSAAGTVGSALYNAPGTAIRTAKGWIGLGEPAAVPPVVE